MYTYYLKASFKLKICRKEKKRKKGGGAGNILAVQ